MSDRERIFGWDLPPGVRTCDLPGNRPEDVKLEQEIEAFEEELGTLIDTHLRHAEQMEPMHVNESLVSIANSNKAYDKEQADTERQQITHELGQILDMTHLYGGVIATKVGPNELKVQIKGRNPVILHILPYRA